MPRGPFLQRARVAKGKGFCGSAKLSPEFCFLAVWLGRVTQPL